MEVRRVLLVMWGAVLLVLFEGVFVVGEAQVVVMGGVGLVVGHCDDAGGGGLEAEGFAGVVRCLNCSHCLRGEGGGRVLVEKKGVLLLLSNSRCILMSFRVQLYRLLLLHSDTGYRVPHSMRLIFK